MVISRLLDSSLEALGPERNLNSSRIAGEWERGHIKSKNLMAKVTAYEAEAENQENYFLLASIVPLWSILEHSDGLKLRSVILSLYAFSLRGLWAKSADPHNHN